MSTEADFNRAMRNIYVVAKRDLNYNATYFLQMISELGGVAAARQLINSTTPSDGFTTLWLANRLNLTVEAHVVKDEFAELFTREERRRAQLRLDAYAAK